MIAQPYRLLFPLNPSQVEQVDEMFQILFDRIALLEATAGFTTTIITGTGGSGSDVMGPPGADGADGEDGPAGPPGAPGAAGATGAGGPAGPPTIGPMGIDGNDGDDGWPIPGPMGPTGIAGSNGLVGSQGPPGTDGLDGEDGFLTGIDASAYARLRYPNNYADIQTFEKQYYSPLVDDGNSGTTKTLDWNEGNEHYLTLTGNVTLTLSNPLDGGRYVIVLATGAGGFTVNWPSTVKWAGNTPPTITTTASRYDLVTMMYIASANRYVASFSQDYN